MAKSRISKQRQQVISDYRREWRNFQRRQEYAGVSLEIEKLTDEQLKTLELKNIREEIERIHGKRKLQFEAAKRKDKELYDLGEEILKGRKRPEAFGQVYRKDQQALANFYKGIKSFSSRNFDKDSAEFVAFVQWMSRQPMMTQLLIIRAFLNSTDRNVWTFVYQSDLAIYGSDKEDQYKELFRIGSAFGYRRPPKWKIQNMLNNGFSNEWAKVNSPSYVSNEELFIASEATDFEEYSKFKSSVANWNPKDAIIQENIYKTTERYTKDDGTVVEYKTKQDSEDDIKINEFIKRRAAKR